MVNECCVGLFPRVLRWYSGPFMYIYGRRLVSTSPGKIFGLLKPSKWRRYSCSYSSRSKEEENEEKSKKKRERKRGKEANDQLNCEERRRCKKTTGKLGINGHNGERGRTQSKRRTRQRLRKRVNTIVEGGKIWLDSHDRG